MHVLSGYVFFASFAPKDQPVLAYSMLYNSFVFVAAGVCFVCAAAVLPALARAPFVLSQALTHE
jgi:thiamine transporter ThiT